MYKESRQIRGIPLWLLREYLEELGGTAVSETRVEGEGGPLPWQKWSRLPSARYVSGKS